MVVYTTGVSRWWKLCVITVLVQTVFFTEKTNASDAQPEPLFRLDVKVDGEQLWLPIFNGESSFIVARDFCISVNLAPKSGGEQEYAGNNCIQTVKNALDDGISKNTSAEDPAVHSPQGSVEGSDSMTQPDLPSSSTMPTTPPSDQQPLAAADNIPKTHDEEVSRATNEIGSSFGPLHSCSENGVCGRELLNIPLEITTVTAAGELATMPETFTFRDGEDLDECANKFCQKFDIPPEECVVLKEESLRLLQEAQETAYPSTMIKEMGGAPVQEANNQMASTDPNFGPSVHEANSETASDISTFDLPPSSQPASNQNHQQYLTEKEEVRQDTASDVSNSQAETPLNVIGDAREMDLKETESTEELPPIRTILPVVYDGALKTIPIHEGDSPEDAVARSKKSLNPSAEDIEYFVEYVRSAMNKLQCHPYHDEIVKKTVPLQPTVPKPLPGDSPAALGHRNRLLTLNINLGNRVVDFILYEGQSAKVEIGNFCAEHNISAEFEAQILDAAYHMLAGNTYPGPQVPESKTVNDSIVDEVLDLLRASASSSHNEEIDVLSVILNQPNPPFLELIDETVIASIGALVVLFVIWLSGMTLPAVALPQHSSSPKTEAPLKIKALLAQKTSGKDDGTVPGSKQPASSRKTSVNAKCSQPKQPQQQVKAAEAMKRVKFAVDAKSGSSPEATNVHSKLQDAASAASAPSPTSGQAPSKGKEALKCALEELSNTGVCKGLAQSSLKGEILWQTGAFELSPHETCDVMRMMKSKKPGMNIRSTSFTVVNRCLGTGFVAKTQDGNLRLNVKKSGSYVVVAVYGRTEEAEAKAALERLLESFR